MSSYDHCIRTHSHSLSHCSVVLKRHHDQGKYYKREHLIGGLLRVSELVQYHHGGEHGGMQAGAGTILRATP